MKYNNYLLQFLGSKQDLVQKIRADIRDFKIKSKVDTVIVLWTANTERFCDVYSGLNDTAENLLNSIQKDCHEVSPSTLYAVASILENVFLIKNMLYNWGEFL